jgi:hypothetical protein
MSPGSTRSCTRERGHSGPHVAHGLFGTIREAWEGGRVVGTSPAARAEGLPVRRPHIPPGGAGFGRELLDRLAGLGTNVETILFLVLFVAFVAFAIHWLLLIFGGPP